MLGNGSDWQFLAKLDLRIDLLGYNLLANILFLQEF